MAAVLDKKSLVRDKRAQGIAAMGLVNREGDRFRVTTPSLRGRRSSYEVWRDEAGKVRCSCLEFEEQSTSEPSFRCEHILAVKHSLLQKNSEAVTKQPTIRTNEPAAATDAKAAGLRPTLTTTSHPRSTSKLRPRRRPSRPPPRARRRASYGSRSSRRTRTARRLSSLRRSRKRKPSRSRNTHTKRSKR